MILLSSVVSISDVTILLFLDIIIIIEVAREGSVMRRHGLRKVTPLGYYSGRFSIIGI